MNTTTQAAPSVSTLQLLPLKEVRNRVGLSTATIYRMMAAGTFPKQRKVGVKSLWRSDEIDAWILAQLTGETASPQSKAA